MTNNRLIGSAAILLGGIVGTNSPSNFAQDNIESVQDEVEFRIAHLINNLSSDNYYEREKASDELTKMKSILVMHQHLLHEALQNAKDDEDLSYRLRKVLREVEDESQWYAKTYQSEKPKTYTSMIDALYDLADNTGVIIEPHFSNSFHSENPPPAPNTNFKGMTFFEGVKKLRSANGNHGIKINISRNGTVHVMEYNPDLNPIFSASSGNFVAKCLPESLTNNSPRLYINTSSLLDVHKLESITLSAVTSNGKQYSLPVRRSTNNTISFSMPTDVEFEEGETMNLTVSFDAFAYLVEEKRIEDLSAKATISTALGTLTVTNISVTDHDYIAHAALRKNEQSENRNRFRLQEDCIVAYDTEGRRIDTPYARGRIDDSGALVHDFEFNQKPADVRMLLPSVKGMERRRSITIKNIPLYKE